MAAWDGLHRWAEFEAAAPDMAAVGRGLLHGDSDVAIGFLATMTAAGGPNLAPVCPIFCDGDICLSVGADTPKRRDLDADGRYALHAFLGDADAEFRITGVAQPVTDEPHRQRVQAAIAFGAFDRDDPIYRLWIARCLHGCWENVGRPDTRPVRRWWRVSGR